MVLQANNLRGPRRGERRVKVADATIQVLAHEGARGLTYRMVDLAAKLPAGSTSNYFRTRMELLSAAAHRIVELDLQDMKWQIGLAESLEGELATKQFADKLASTLIDWLSPKNRDRTLARAELFLEATRDATLKDIMTGSTEAFMLQDMACFRAVGAKTPELAARSLVHFILGAVYGRAILPSDRSGSAELKALCRSTIATLKEQ